MGQQFSTHYGHQPPGGSAHAGSTNRVGTIVALVLGSLFASCFVCGGIATLLEDDSEQPTPGEQLEQARAVDQASSNSAEAASAAEGPLMPAECEAAFNNAERLLPGLKTNPPPAEACAKSSQWDQSRATVLRCVARAELVVELQVCSASWMETVEQYMKLNAGAHAVDPGSAKVVADLGVGPRAGGHLDVVANGYGVSATKVGDKAAKAAELCLGGMDMIAARPAKAVGMVEGALEYAAEVAADEKARTMISLDDLFVTYVTLGCPEPGSR